MAGKLFKKASTLRVGTHHSPDGKVVVTPQRLRHWADTFAAMSAAGQVIPMHWDHASDPEDLKPIAMSDFKDKKTRSAEKSVGRLTKFDVAEDGNSAEIEIQTLTDGATEKVEANAVYVSPVIMPNWQDGSGNKYADAITHVDLVNHPVDHGQGPAVPVEGDAVCCAIRLGLNPTPYRLAQDEPPNGDPPAGDESNPDDGGNGNGSATVADVIPRLRKIAKLSLPDDTTAANFLDRLNVALMTAEAQNGEPEDMNGDQNNGNQTKVVEPDVATMSLESRAALKFGEKAYKEGISQRLQVLLDTGRCTPDEFKTQAERVGAVKLSLDAEGNPAKSDVETFLDNRESVPQGTFWDADEKLKRLSVEPQPKPVHFGGDDNGEMSAEDADKAADEVLGAN